MKMKTKPPSLLLPLLLLLSIAFPNAVSAAACNSTIKPLVLFPPPSPEQQDSTAVNVVELLKPDNNVTRLPVSVVQDATVLTHAIASSDQAEEIGLRLRLPRSDSVVEFARHSFPAWLNDQSQTVVGVGLVRDPTLLLLVQVNG